MGDYWKKLDESRRAQGPARERPADSEAPPEPPTTPWARSSPAAPSPSWRQPSDRPRTSPSPQGQPAVSERKARLTITLLAGSFAVLVIGLVVFFTVRTLREGTDNPVSGATSAEDAGALGGIGPPPGVELGTYAEARKAALAQATDDRLAVVSLSRYATEGDARTAVGGAQVVALLAAAPGGQPSVVTGDVAEWVNAQTADARAERDEIQRLIPTAKEDPGFQSFYRSEVDRLDKLISSIRPGGDLVFGLVVRAPAPALQQLAGKPEVRLVDVGPSADPGPKPTYRGVRPEETGKANEPNTRPL